MKKNIVRKIKKIRGEIFTHKFAIKNFYFIKRNFIINIFYIIRDTISRHHLEEIVYLRFCQMPSLYAIQSDFGIS